MTAEPHVPHVVTVAEHTVYTAVCVTCPWVVDGFLDPDWAQFVAEKHEKGHSVAPETTPNDTEETP